MPWPDFSELSFGYAFLREFERTHAPGGAFPSAPDFITQNKEAEKGYDVSILDGSTPVFFQFKRSFVLTTCNAKEIQIGDFASPILYRMHLREKAAYRQHRALQELENDGHRVLYVTSQIESPLELTKAYVRNDVLARTAALFTPNEIVLPDLDHKHHLCFKADDDFAFLYSEEGRRFVRKIPNWGTAREKVFLPGRRSEENNRSALASLAEKLSLRSSAAREIAERFDDPVIKASVLSFLVLDVLLTFYREPA